MTPGVQVLGFVLVPVLVLVLVLVDTLVYVPVPLLVEVPVQAVPGVQLPEIESQHTPKRSADPYREITPLFLSSVLGLLMMFIAYGRMVLRLIV